MRDRALMVGLLALFVIVAGLHLKELSRTGLALPPVFAVLEAGGDGTPVVGGLRLERSATWNDLEVGDRLLRVGDVDLKGVPYAGFDAVVLAEAGTAPTVPLIYERGGERRQIDLALQPYARPWSRLPLMLSLAGLATIVLLRSPGTRQGRLFFAGVVLIAAGELPFYGGPRLQTYAYIALFNIGLPLGIWLWLRWLVGFPDGVPDEKRVPQAVAWVALVFPLARISYHLGGPVETSTVPALVLASDALLGTTSVAIATWNYIHANPVGRRQVKWVVLGGYVGCLPLIAAALGTWVAPGVFGGVEFHELFPLVMIAPLAVVLGMFIGILRYNLLDIDRIMSATAAYSVSAGLTLGVVPWLAAWLADVMVIDEGGARFAVTLIIAVAVLPLFLRVRGPIERFFFPQRQHLERGVQQLLHDLGDCDERGLVAGLVSMRLEGLFEPGYVTTLALGPTGVETISGPPAQGVDADGAFVRWLSSHSWPALVDRRRFGQVLVERDAQTELLAGSAPAMVLPLRDGKDLAYFLLLGPPRSGDTYTPTDLTLCGSIAERASSQLRALRDGERLESERLRGDELQSSKEAVEQAYASRSRFLAAASHDLRQPLHALGLFVDSLDRSIEEGKTDPDLVRRIRGSTTSLVEMFDSLLDISRLDVGAVAPNVGAFELEALLAEIAQQVEPLARRKRLELHLSCEEGAVSSDRVLLGRIVRNFAVNAVRYTERGEVALAARRDGEDMVIEVRDTGPGIPNSSLREIFDEFTQLGGPGQGGLGLGLSIVSRLAALLGHEVSVESTEGEGSVFRVRVPRAHVDSARSAPERAGTGMELDGCRVLVVDDDLEILEGMGQLLRSWGCRVTLAACMDDVEESLGVADPPSVVLADYRLGHGETGFDAIEAVRRVAGVDVPAAIVSGESMANPPEGLRVVRKPVPPIRLRALLIELLGEQRAGTR